MFHITYFNLLHALCFSACLAHSFEYYVSTIGSDGNTGTAAAPFRTLSRAQNEVRGKLPSQTSNIYVYVEDGVYELDSPLNLTARDSGQNGFKVIWQAKGTLVNVSGGNQITNWTMYNKTAGIYQATVPKNSISRHLYANQVHAQRARATLTRSWLSATTSGYLVVNSAANYLLSLPGIEHGEIRGINSFTDRYIPVDSVSDGVILMKQPAYQNNIIGYDTITVPAADEGFYIENVLALLDEPNEFYLNSSTNTVYYIPPVGLDPNDMYIVLPKNEQVLVFSGTLDEPVHDIMFVGFNFMHTTWNYPSGDVGYADQQTGAFIGLNESYTIFESSRPFWWQVPGSIQMSAAHDIVIQNGSMVAIMGGFGIGNDPNAHTSGVGLGANNITISGIYFTQTGHNCITVGGVQADAHHPSDSRMLNSNIMISENIFSNTQITYTSGVPIFVSYATNAQIIHNDISVVPYSGICYGFGWGSNDAGGSEEYLLRGLYNYQPIYTTPTTLTDGLISNNLIHDYGLRHTDLGGIYTLSKSPNTFITENYAYSDNGYGTNCKYPSRRHYIRVLKLIFN
ncbi:hypothetical protein OIDMADRAFT_127477 [Oidiodendron maius Zn]|uniref:Right handed beta helix domain-containing protein n=1 Tax=Oidiodendron maius (strain Zn) TaxID=913774 RepID=A0A0C3CK91_OIDMZ|nr:hypothetical protein OIDMADRAFT_127477 [Oidiodendron maius Zn]